MIRKLLENGIQKGKEKSLKKKWYSKREKRIKGQKNLPILLQKELEDSPRD